MPTVDQTPVRPSHAESQSAPLRSWSAQTATMDRGALAGALARAPGAPVANRVEPQAQFPTVPAASESGAVPSMSVTNASADGATSTRPTLGAQGESRAITGAVAASQVPQAPADRVRDANGPRPSEALETVDAPRDKQQAATLPVSVDAPVREAPRVAAPRRPQTTIALPSSPASAVAVSKASEQGPAGQVAAVSPTDTVAEVAAGPARQTRQSGGRSSADARDPNQFDSLAEQNLGVASTPPTSTASPARKTEVLTLASPRPTGTAAIAIAAFQAAAAAAPDVHRSASIGGTSVMSAALMDTQVRTPIVDAIRFQADNGNGQVRLRLNPEFLGDVSVDVRVNGGSVVASVHASSADVREWLRTNEAVLRQTLADQGLHLERLVIAEEEAQPGNEHPDQQREGASDQQREWERRSRRPRETGTFEVVL